MLKRATILRLAVACLMLATGATPDASARPHRLELVRIWVAPNGADTAAGHAGTPLKTVAGARDRIRQLRAAKPARGPYEVVFKTGEYRLTETVSFDDRDSGTLAQPIMYRAADGADVRITGGLTIDGRQAGAVVDQAILGRLPAAARSQVRVVDLAAAGLTDLGGYRNYGYGRGTNPAQAELFVDDAPMTLAKWPNNGAGAPIGTVLDPGSKPSAGETDGRGAVFTIPGAPLDRWQQADQAFASSYFWFGWAYDSIKIAGLDQAAGTVTLADPHNYGVRSGQEWSRVTISNLLEEIDQPGEYFVDHETLKAYFYPRTASPARIGVSVLDTPMLSMINTSHVTFLGLRFQNSRGSAVYLEGGAGVRIAGNTFANLGEVAVSIGQGVANKIPASNVIGNLQSYLGSNSAWNRNGGTDHRVISNNIVGTGAGGIFVGAGDRKTLTSSNILVANNRITDYNRWLTTAAPGIWLMGVGIIAEHNLIHGADQRAMFVNGNLHQVRLNEIFDVVRNADDVGGVGMYRDPSEFGNLFEHNFIHDSGGNNAQHGSQAIFLDDGTSGQTIRGNVFVRSGSNYAVKLHGGRHNRVENNIFVDLPTAVGIAQWGEQQWKDTVNGADFQKKLLQQVDIRQAPFATRYPTLAGYVDAAGVATTQPVNTNVVADNVTVNVASLTSNQEFTIGDNFTTEVDPGFADPAALDYSLAATSPVFTELPGFDPIPFGQIGLQVDQYRTSLQQPIGAFDVTAPARGQTGVDATVPVPLSWQPAAGANAYRVQVATDADFTQLILDRTVFATQTELGLILTGNTSYHWRVVASTGARTLIGSATNAGGTATFTTAAGDPDSVPAPVVTAAAQGDGAVALQWPAVASAVRYEVARSAGNSAAAQVIATVTGTGYRDAVGSQLAPDSYTVRAFDDADRASVPSAAVTAQGGRTALYATVFTDGFDAAWQPGPDTVATDWVAGQDESSYTVVRHTGAADQAALSTQLITPAAHRQYDLRGRVQLLGVATGQQSTASAGLVATTATARYLLGIAADGRLVLQRDGDPATAVTSSTALTLNRPHDLRLVLTQGRVIGLADDQIALELTDPGLTQMIKTGLYGYRSTAEYTNIDLAGLTAPDTSLPAGWQLSNYSPAPATATYADGQYLVGSTCADVWGSSDQAAFVNRSATLSAGGTTELRAKVDSLTGGTDAAMAGLMIRAADTADAANFFARLTRSGRLQTTHRATTGGTTANVSRVATVPAEIKIIRSGNTFTSYLLENGAWVQAATATIAMPDEVRVGVAVCSRDAAQAATALFSEVNIVSP